MPARTRIASEGKGNESQGYLKLAPGVLTNITVPGAFGISTGCGHNENFLIAPPCLLNRHSLICITAFLLCGFEICSLEFK